MLVRIAVAVVCVPLLLLAMLVGMLPQTVLAAAADYTQPYLNQLVNWGFKAAACIATL